MKGLIGGFYHVSEWIMKFSAVNLLWLLFNLPIVLIVMNMIFVDRPRNLFILVALLGIMAPFILFPATAAMFASVRDWVLKTDTSSIFRSFWNYYKENYKRSLLGGLILTGAWIVWGVDYYYFNKLNVMLMFTFLLLGILLYVYTLNFFSLMAHYDLKLRSLLKKSFLFTFGSPILSGAVFLGSGLIIYVSINGLLFLIPFFTGSLIAFISFSAFYRVYLNLTNRS
ncbi:YesL family protein [Halalkalibacter lacteus]|uniref:YesL family protein n=1 Tax=Halalkalibacter lacteus TaxID=3090663 RepID=UPI002FCC7F14